MNFHSGFLTKIEEYAINDVKYMDQTDNSRALVKTLLYMNNVNVTYELDSDLEEYKARSSMVIWMPGLEFEVSVTRNHETGLVEPSISFTNFFGSVTKIANINFPSNAYTQLISREVNFYYLQFEITE